MSLKSLPWMILTVAVVWFFFFRSGSDDHDGYQAALARAATSNKVILLDFTGSDWCGWCVKLDEETFAKSEFLEFARENLEFVVVDFPRNKPLSEEDRAQNQNLKAKFGVQGYPTLVLVDAMGNEIGRQRGYLPGGPKALIQWVQTARGGS